MNYVNLSGLWADFSETCLGGGGGVRTCEMKLFQVTRLKFSTH